MSYTIEQLKRIIEAALMVAGSPLSIEQLSRLFEEPPSNKELKEIIHLIAEDHRGRVTELVEVASGFRFQIMGDVHPWLQKLSEERPRRPSRALLETLALIAYRQPITRAEIEEVRGVVVSSDIISNLEGMRNWIRIVGHRDVPGKPALYATTKQFLDDFNLKSLADLPTLVELTNLEDVESKLGMQLQLTVAEEPTQLQ